MPTPSPPPPHPLPPPSLPLPLPQMHFAGGIAGRYRQWAQGQSGSRGGGEGGLPTPTIRLTLPFFLPVLLLLLLTLYSLSLFVQEYNCVCVQYILYPVNSSVNKCLFIFINSSVNKCLFIFTNSSVNKCLFIFTNSSVIKCLFIFTELFQGGFNRYIYSKLSYILGCNISRTNTILIYTVFFVLYILCCTIQLFSLRKAENSA